MTAATDLAAEHMDRMNAMSEHIGALRERGRIVAAIWGMTGLTTDELDFRYRVLEAIEPHEEQVEV